MSSNKAQYLLHMQTQPSECLLAHKQQTGRLSLVQATTLLTSISLGLLLVTASLCWYTVGWVVGIISVVLAALLQIQSSSALVRLIFDQGCYSYEDIALVYLGKKCQAIVNYSLMVGQTSVCIGSLYVSSTSLKGFLDQIIDRNPAWLSYQLCVVMAGLTVLPFSIQKEIKGVKAGSIVNIILVLCFIASFVIYFLSNYRAIRASHPDSDFTVSIFPQKPFSQIIPKITIIICLASFNPGATPIFHALRHTTKRRAMIPIIIAVITAIGVFVLIGAIGALLFGPLILSQDSVIKVLYLESSSFITPLTQLIFSFIAIYHSPAYVFAARQSILTLLNAHFQWAKKEGVSPEMKASAIFPKMYDRVPHWLFYTVAFVFLATIVLITCFISNLIMFLQIVGLPILIFLNFLFPNLAIIKAKGMKKEPFALLNIAVAMTAGVLPFLFGILGAL